MNFMGDDGERIARAVSILSSASNVVAFTGAGISTPSGIPDFRSPDSGMWEKADPFRVASITGFRRDPSAFFEWIRPLARLSINAKPNVAHYALLKLEQLGKLKSIITQNIDTLHTKAGSNPVHELHGQISSATCITCYKKFPATDLIRQFVETGHIPRCDCERQSILKPNVILFGEQLPFETLQAAKKAVRACDVLFVIGSSLEVAPASEIPLLAKRNGAKVIIINLHATDFDGMADVVLKGDAADLVPNIVKQVETALHASVQ
ncbi:MAG: NAD-dependent deacylase [Anaerolineae bacterium]|nr:NAD-dependent deacylase [Anaerolineae bacterium]